MIFIENKETHPSSAMCIWLAHRAEPKHWPLGSPQLPGWHKADAATWYLQTQRGHQQLLMLLLRFLHGPFENSAVFVEKEWNKPYSWHFNELFSFRIQGAKPPCTDGCNSMVKRKGNWNTQKFVMIYKNTSLLNRSLLPYILYKNFHSKWTHVNNLLYKWQKF